MQSLDPRKKSEKDAGGGQPLRVVFLIGADNRSTRMSIEAVCQTPGVEAVSVLLDTDRDAFLKRVKNLRRNFKKHGWHYLPARALEQLRMYSDWLVDHAVVTRAEVLAVLHRAFPERCFSLKEVATKYGFDVSSVGNLNGPAAVAALKGCRADLGIVLGTRVLKPTTFDLPALGSINLHKGRVPTYRGMPPGFWELYDGALTAGVTVHHVAAKLDAGDVIEASEVPISPRDTPDSLLEKLHVEGARALTRAVAAIRSETAQRWKQTELTLKPRSKPTIQEVEALRQRLPHWERQSDGAILVKNLFSLAVYYSGLYAVRRKCRKGSRAAVLLYHRINDYANDKLTVGAETFAAQLLAISQRYPTISSTQLVEHIRQKAPLTPTTVLIHFDDAYRDVCGNGAPILSAVGVPATAFVNSGYVDTDRVFPHDLEKYPFYFENYRSSDLREWIERGFEIGAHTVNHVDLGKCTLGEARHEIEACASQLQAITGTPVSLLSFPFGREANIRKEVVELTKNAGYTALFSAHGGFVTRDTDVWDIPRFGSNDRFKPLHLLLEIEGLSPAQIVDRLKRIWSKTVHSNDVSSRVESLEPLLREGERRSTVSL